MRNTCGQLQSHVCILVLLRFSKQLFLLKHVFSHFKNSQSETHAQSSKVQMFKYVFVCLDTSRSHREINKIREIRFAHREK